MTKEVFPEVVCPFCQRKLEDVRDYNRTHTCACGARYFVQGEWDDGPYWDEIFGNEVGKNVEVRIIRSFDNLVDFEGQDPATGERLDLFFGRLVSASRWKLFKSWLRQFFLRR